MFMFADGTTVIPIEVDSIVKAAMFIHKNIPAVGLLMLTIGADIAFGICAAVMTKTLSSSISHRGMARKAMMILWVALGYGLEPYAGGLPVAGSIGACFAITNLISIMENSVRCGVPVPKSITDVLVQLRTNEKASVAVKTPPVVIDKASNVDIHMTDGAHADGEKKADSVIITPKPKDVVS